MVGTSDNLIKALAEMSRMGKPILIKPRYMLIPKENITIVDGDTIITDRFGRSFNVGRRI